MSEQQAKKESDVIEEHKKMVIMTGMISDFQLENLKTWPFILFSDDLDQVKLSYDFTKTVSNDEELSAGKVTYDFYFKKGSKLDRADTKKQLETLSLWTRFMFWKETEVTCLRNGKKWEI